MQAERVMTCDAVRDRQCTVHGCIWTVHRCKFAELGEMGKLHQTRRAACAFRADASGASILRERRTKGCTGACTDAPCNLNQHGLLIGRPRLGRVGL
jgi:hypothetical protein